MCTFPRVCVPQSEVTHASWRLTTQGSLPLRPWEVGRLSKRSSRARVRGLGSWCDLHEGSGSRASVPSRAEAVSGSGLRTSLRDREGAAARTRPLLAGRTLSASCLCSDTTTGVSCSPQPNAVTVGLLGLHNHVSQFLKFIYLSTYLSTYLPVYLSTCPSISIQLSLSLSIICLLHTLSLCMFSSLTVTCQHWLPSYGKRTRQTRGASPRGGRTGVRELFVLLLSFPVNPKPSEISSPVKRFQWRMFCA